MNVLSKPADSVNCGYSCFILELFIREMRGPPVLLRTSMLPYHMHTADKLTTAKKKLIVQFPFGLGYPCTVIYTYPSFLKYLQYTYFFYLVQLCII